MFAQVSFWFDFHISFLHHPEDPPELKSTHPELPFLTKAGKIGGISMASSYLL